MLEAGARNEREAKLKHRENRNGNEIPMVGFESFIALLIERETAPGRRLLASDFTGAKCLQQLPVREPPANRQQANKAVGIVVVTRR